MAIPQGLGPPPITKTGHRAGGVSTNKKANHHTSECDPSRLQSRGTLRAKPANLRGRGTGYFVQDNG